MQKQGTVIRWDATRAFGFIRSPDTSADVFFHVRDYGAPPRRAKDSSWCTRKFMSAEKDHGAWQCCLRPSKGAHPPPARWPHHPLSGDDTNRRSGRPNPRLNAAGALQSPVAHPPPPVRRWC